MASPIRILVTDDHAFLRHIIGSLLESQGDMIVVGKASNGAEAVELAQALHPDVVLMDYEMPEKGGARAIKEILKSHPTMPIIGFSGHEDDMVKRVMLEAGATIYVSKNSDTSELLSAIRSYHARNNCA